MYCQGRYDVLHYCTGPHKCIESPERLSGTFHKRGIFTMKRIKGDIVYYALWLTAITSMVLASGAPDKWRP